MTALTLFFFFFFLKKNMWQGQPGVPEIATFCGGLG
jgi:hypothetical protein